MFLWMPFCLCVFELRTVPLLLLRIRSAHLKMVSVRNVGFVWNLKRKLEVTTHFNLEKIVLHYVFCSFNE